MLQLSDLFVFWQYEINLSMQHGRRSILALTIYMWRLSADIILIPAKEIIIICSFIGGAYAQIFLIPVRDNSIILL